MPVIVSIRRFLKNQIKANRMVVRIHVKDQSKVYKIYWMQAIFALSFHQERHTTEQHSLYTRQGVLQFTCVLCTFRWKKRIYQVLTTIFFLFGSLEACQGRGVWVKSSISFIAASISSSSLSPAWDVISDQGDTRCRIIYRAISI